MSFDSCVPYDTLAKCHKGGLKLCRKGPSRTRKGILRQTVYPIAL